MYVDKKKTNDKHGGRPSQPGIKINQQYGRRLTNKTVQCGYVLAIRGRMGLPTRRSDALTEGINITCLTRRRTMERIHVFARLGCDGCSCVLVVMVSCVYVDGVEGMGMCLFLSTALGTCMYIHMDTCIGVCIYSDI